MLTRILSILTLIAVAAALPSCARGRASTPLDLPLTEEAAEDYTASLRKLAERQIEAQEMQRNENKEKVIRRKPYFYKEYAQYPDGARNLEIDTSQTESRTRPLRAEVKVAKIRYATKLRNGREAARLDDNFYRDTGTETMAFELRNGRWTRVGSIFVSEKREQQVNGQWVPVQEEPLQAAPEEKSKGWFGRTFSFITGGG